MASPDVHRREFGGLAPSSIDPRLTSVCVCLVSIGPLGPRFFKVVTTSLHFLSAFHVCIPWPFAWLVRAQEAPWGRVLPANATPSSLHLRPGSVQDVACISVNRAIHGACGSLECSCFGIEVQGWDSCFSSQSCRWRPLYPPVILRRHSAS